MHKILIFLWLTAPLVWAGKNKQDAPSKKTSLDTSEIEILRNSGKQSNFEPMSKEESEEESEEENSDAKDYTREYRTTPCPEEKKESAKDAWHKAQRLTKEEIYEEIMEDLPDLLNEKIEEKLRKIQEDTNSLSNPWKKEEENPGFVKRLTQKIWSKNPSTIADDAIYASKTTLQKDEEKGTERSTPSGTKSLIKRVGHEVKTPLKKVILPAGLFALGFFANEFKNEFFPKDTGNEELDDLTHQMNNCTLNATTNSTETSWFEGQFGAPLNQMTNLLENSWSTLWGRTEEAQKEISSHINHLPETEELTQKSLSSTAETEL